MPRQLKPGLLKQAPFAFMSGRGRGKNRKGGEEKKAAAKQRVDCEKTRHFAEIWNGGVVNSEASGVMAPSSSEGILPVTSEEVKERVVRKPRGYDEQLLRGLWRGQENKESTQEIDERKGAMLIGGLVAILEEKHRRTEIEKIYFDAEMGRIDEEKKHAEGSFAKKKFEISVMAEDSIEQLKRTLSLAPGHDISSSMQEAQKIITETLT